MKRPNSRAGSSKLRSTTACSRRHQAPWDAPGLPEAPTSELSLRRIPIRLQPASGESLDSWIIAYAARLRTPVRDLGAALGISLHFLCQPLARVALGEGIADVAPLAAGSGLSLIELESLWRPLVRYSGVVRDWFGYALLGQGAKVLPWS